jgi:hypothetical protein
LTKHVPGRVTASREEPERIAARKAAGQDGSARQKPREEMVTPFRAASTQVNGLFQQDRMTKNVISATRAAFQEWNGKQE